MNAEDKCYSYNFKNSALKSSKIKSKNTSLLSLRMRSINMKNIYFRLLFLILSISALYCSSVQGVNKKVRKGEASDTVLIRRIGTASYYAAKFQGRRTSNGERLDNDAYTCASYLPYDTWLRVTHLRNGKSVIVRVTDRFHPGGSHLVDLTLRAAKDIDMVRFGIARIRMEMLNPNFILDFLPKDSITLFLPFPKMKPFVPVPSPDFKIGTYPR